MAYVPNNLSMYLAAYAGALAGMGVSDRVPSNPSAGAYTGLAGVAGAFAQAFDMVWALTPADTLTVEAAQEICESAWQERAPQAVAPFLTPGTYTTLATALVAIIQAGSAYTAGQGIVPPPIPGGGGIDAVVYTNPGAPTTSPIHSTRGANQSPSDPLRVGTVNIGSTTGGGTGTTGDYATISGGKDHVAAGVSSTVSGGNSNAAGADFSTVGGGDTNTAGGLVSTIGGGQNNQATGNGSTVGGGNVNIAGGVVSTIAGGFSNTAPVDNASVGGGAGNTASGLSSTVAGGFACAAHGDGSSVGGGLSNTVVPLGTTGTIGGGNSNTVGVQSGTIAGGDSNVVGGFWGSVGGGFSNSASGQYSSIPGGQNCVASGDWSHACGLNANAIGPLSTALGNTTNASGNASFACGNSNAANGDASHASGQSCIANGNQSQAAGFECVAQGNQSNAKGNQSIALRTGQDALASGVLAVPGDAQTSILVLRGSTPGLAPGESVELTYGANEFFSLEDGKAYILMIEAVAVRTLPFIVTTAFLRGVDCYRTGGVSSISGVTVPVDFGGATGWTLGIAVLPGPDRIAITFTTSGTERCNIAASIRFAEVTTP